MRRILAFFLVAAILAPTAYAESIKDRHIQELVSYKRTWEKGWSNQWKLIDASEQYINNFRKGIILQWQLETGTETWKRTDTFTSDWKFYGGHEELWKNDRLVARGPIFIAPGGTRLFRILVFLGDIPMKDEILFYELHTFSQGNVKCKYRSKFNFIGFGAGPMRGLRRVPDDAILINGEDCLGIDQLKANPFRDRLPE